MYTNLLSERTLVEVVVMVAWAIVSDGIAGFDIVEGGIAFFDATTYALPNIGVEDTVETTIGSSCAIFIFFNGFGFSDAFF